MPKLLSILFILFNCSILIAAEGQWVQKAGFPGSGRHGAISFTIGNKAYVGMGHINSGPLGEVYFNDIWEYDPASDSWTQKADYPEAAFAYGMAFSHNNLGYIGFDYTLFSFNPQTNSYIQKADPIFSLVSENKINIEIYNEIVFVMQASMHSYSPLSDTWNSINF